MTRKTDELEKLCKALVYLAKDVGCAECPLRKVCSSMGQEYCIRAEAKEIINAINEDAE